MKTADEMFKELGYRKTKNYNPGTMLHYIRSSNLSANEFEHIEFLYNKKINFRYTYCSFNKNINMKELQVINKKCKELGWIE